jgi:hypothetical protein
MATQREASISLRRMLQRALKRPNDGRLPFRPVVWDTTGLTEPDHPTRVLVSFDMGAHASGWWRNAEYDRCWHVSISHPAGVVAGERPHHIEPPSVAETQAWARAAFPVPYRWCWLEPPASPDSYDVQQQRRRPGVAHIRLFLDRRSRAILPRGEVYNLLPWADGASPSQVFRS